MPRLGRKTGVVDMGIDTHTSEFSNSEYSEKQDYAELHASVDERLLHAEDVLK